MLNSFHIEIYTYILLVLGIKQKFIRLSNHQTRVARLRDRKAYWYDKQLIGLTPLVLFIIFNKLVLLIDFQSYTLYIYNIL